MGETILSQEILEHVLQFADGETLLTCREVSPEFAAAVKYLGRTKNIWEKCYLKEKGEKYPYGIISKFHPHNEGLNHPKNWGLIYETCLLSSFIASKEPPQLSELKIGKEYSDIEYVETHEDLILVLVKYNKDFSIFYKILTFNLENNLIDKSCRFYANMLYITPIEDPSKLRTDAIMLPCDMCQLFAIPVCADDSVVGFPKFSQSDDCLRIEHSNGEFLWVNNFVKLLTKGRCFLTGKDPIYEEYKRKALNSVKIFQRLTNLYISCGETHREFNTFEDLQACVTASCCYSDLLFLGTHTGKLYVYDLSSKLSLSKLTLKCYIQQYNVCPDSILVINVMELKNQFVILCASEKSLYFIHINRRLQNFS